jgi:hypothetical protein
MKHKIDYLIVTETEEVHPSVQEDLSKTPININNTPDIMSHEEKDN